MTEKLNSGDLRRYALLGAEARLLELGKEADSIYQAFPELRRRELRRRGARSVPEAPSTGATSGGRRKRGRTMSNAQREEVSARMKRYWAQRRGAAAAAQGAEPGAAEGKAARRSSKGGRRSGTRGRRKMSAAARKQISDAQKARWAKRKKANA
jgi:hypothetical protein